MDVDNLATVKMVVLDGIIMGLQHCAFHNCTEGLANACNGVFCKHHEAQHLNITLSHTFPRTPQELLQDPLETQESLRIP